MEIGQKYARWVFTARSDSIVAHMDSAGRAQPGARQQIDESAVQLALRAGDEVKVLDEKFITRNGMRQYWRTSTFKTMNESLIVRIVMTSKGEFAGLGLSPASQAPPVDP